MEKLVSVDEPPDYREKWGGHNDLPPNWQELTEKEFAQSEFFTYGPEFTDFRQVILPSKRYPKGVYTDLHLYFFHLNRGFALWHDYWEGKVHYARFALCVHEWQEMSQAWCAKQKPPIYHGGRCYHVSRCKKCGVINAVDSSD